MQKPMGSLFVFPFKQYASLFSLFLGIVVILGSLRNIKISVTMMKTSEIIPRNSYMEVRSVSNQFGQLFFNLP